MNQNLPGFVVLCPGLSGAGRAAMEFGASCHRFTREPISRAVRAEPDKLLANIRNRSLRQRRADESSLIAAGKAEPSYLDRVGHQPELEAGIQTMEVAFRMQTEAPEVFDISRRAGDVRDGYGDSDFGRGCLMALRLVERGTRMVQVYFGNFQPWDSHDDIRLHREAGARGRWSDRVADRGFEGARDVRRDAPDRGQRVRADADDSESAVWRRSGTGAITTFTDSARCWPAAA